MVCFDFYKRSGVRCSPQGRNSGQKKRIDLTLRKTLTPRSSESGFHRNVKFATFEEAGRLCKTIPSKWGKSCTPRGQERPKLHHRNRFSIEHTLDHSVIETRGRAHLTQTTNQHLRIIVKLSSHAPSNHLEHLSNTSHRLPLKEIKGYLRIEVS